MRAFVGELAGHGRGGLLGVLLLNLTSLWVFVAEYEVNLNYKVLKYYSTLFNNLNIKMARIGEHIM